VIIPLEVLSGRWNIKMSFIIRRSSVGFLPLDMTKIEGCVDFTVGYFLHFFAGCNKWKRNTIISRENSMWEIFFMVVNCLWRCFLFCFYVYSGWWWGFVSNIRSRSNFLKHFFHGVFLRNLFYFIRRKSSGWPLRRFSPAVCSNPVLLLTWLVATGPIHVRGSVK